MPLHTQAEGSEGGAAAPNGDPLAISKGNAIIRAVYDIEPNRLSDDEWAKRIQGWRYTKELEMDSFEYRLTKVLYELAGRIYGKGD